VRLRVVAIGPRAYPSGLACPDLITGNQVLSRPFAIQWWSCSTSRRGPSATLQRARRGSLAKLSSCASWMQTATHDLQREAAASDDGELERDGETSPADRPGVVRLSKRACSLTLPWRRRASAHHGQRDRGEQDGGGLGIGSGRGHPRPHRVAAWRYGTRARSSSSPIRLLRAPAAGSGWIPPFEHDGYLAIPRFYCPAEGIRRQF
jgi:hypothetical protein